MNMQPNPNNNYNQNNNANNKPPGINRGSGIDFFWIKKLSEKFKYQLFLIVLDDLLDIEIEIFKDK